MKNLIVNIGSLPIWNQVSILYPVVFYFCPVLSTLINNLYKGTVVELVFWTGSTLIVFTDIIDCQNPDFKSSLKTEKNKKRRK